MSGMEIVLSAAVISLILLVLYVEVRLHKVTEVVKNHTNLFDKIIDTLNVTNSRKDVLDDEYEKVTEMTERVESMLSDLLNGLVLAEKRTDDIVKNLYAEKIKQLKSAKDKRTISSQISPQVTQELTNALNENKKESIKNRIKLLCKGGKEFCSKYIGDDLILLLRELSLYEDTSEFLDENPMVLDMIFQPK